MLRAGDSADERAGLLLFLFGCIGTPLSYLAFSLFDLGLLRSRASTILFVQYQFYERNVARLKV